jgi:hypothetical protein
MAEIVEIVKVRKIGPGRERVVHVPEGVIGYLSLHYDPESGVLRYVPLKETVE